MYDIQMMLDVIPAPVSAASAYVTHAKVVDNIPFLQRNPPMLVKEFLESMRPFHAIPKQYIHW
jgi:hypothetical protein